jgi:hypothetical protein
VQNSGQILSDSFSAGQKENVKTCFVFDVLWFGLRRDITNQNNRYCCSRIAFAGQKVPLPGLRVRVCCAVGLHKIIRLVILKNSSRYIKLILCCKIPLAVQGVFSNALRVKVWCAVDVHKIIRPVIKKKMQPLHEIHSNSIQRINRRRENILITLCENRTIFEEN